MASAGQRQPGRDEENFPRGLLRSYPHPASVPPRRGGRDRGHRALLELRIMSAKRQSKFKTGLPTPILYPLPPPPPQPVGDGCRASSPVAEEERAFNTRAAVPLVQSKNRGGTGCRAWLGWPCCPRLAWLWPEPYELASCRPPAGAVCNGIPNVTRSMAASLMWAIMSAD